jgi:hypothetical protein
MSKKTEQNADIWAFVEEFYPNYFSCEKINVLNKYAYFREISSLTKTQKEHETRLLKGVYEVSIKEYQKLKKNAKNQ